MKVVLIQNVPNLGKIDEIKEVADGYARNFLFARNLAVPASTESINQSRAKQKKEINKEERNLKNQQKLADKLDGYELEIFGKANDNGFLYASVNAEKAAAVLRKKGFPVSKKMVVMEPVKQVGRYPIKIKFPHNLEIEIYLTISAR